MKNIIHTLLFLLPIYLFGQSLQDVKNKKFFIHIGLTETLINNNIPHKSFREYGIGYLTPQYIIQTSIGHGGNAYVSTSFNSYESRLYGVVEGSRSFWEYFGLGIFYKYGSLDYTRLEGEYDYLKERVLYNLIGFSPKLILTGKHFFIAGTLRIPVAGSENIHRETYRSYLPTDDRISTMDVRNSPGFGEVDINLIVNVAYLF